MQWRWRHGVITHRLGRHYCIFTQMPSSYYTCAYTIKLHFSFHQTWPHESFLLLISHVRLKFVIKNSIINIMSCLRVTFVLFDGLLQWALCILYVALTVLPLAMLYFQIHLFLLCQEGIYREIICNDFMFNTVLLKKHGGPSRMTSDFWVGVCS